MTKRIEWIDIFKAFAIILMVVGHSTGIFNRYIYQFHMAAFFFISGYVENFNNKTFFEIFVKKLYRIILPFIIIFISILILVTCLNYTGYYNILFKGEFIGFYRSIREFFRGFVYINWLGATWFLGVLFGIIILQKITYDINKQKIDFTYIIISIVMFFVGYYMVYRKMQFCIFVFPLDLILIGQFYFVLGKISSSKRLIGKIFSYKFIKVISFLTTVFFIWYFGNLYPITVDYPSRRFNKWYIDAVVAINGIIFLYLLSDFISRIKFQKIKKILIMIGKNTLGILFFNFLSFKLAYILLAIFNIVPFSYLNEFTPTTNIGNNYWWLISTISILCSIVMWRLLTKSRIGASLLGQNEELIKKISKYLVKKLYIGKKQSYEENDNNTFFELKVNYIVKNIKANKEIISILILLIIVIMTPILRQGIVINDELQSHFWSMQGFKSFFKHYVSAYMKQGRAISAITDTISMYSSFITSKKEIFRFFSIIGILINVYLFGKFIYKLFKNKLFSIFTMSSILVFLPITFEHTVPNAFVNLLSIPFSLLLISFILFINYIENDKENSLKIACLLLFVALLSYEVFIMITPIYFLLALYKIPRKDNYLRELFKKVALPITIDISYLVLYFFSRIIIPSTYNGNQIGFTLKGMIEIITQLFKSSIPGYYLFNSKYHYLFTKYDLSGIQAFDMRIILVVIFYASIIIYIFKRGVEIKRGNKSLWGDILVVLNGLLFVILPTVPNAISKMYQNNVNSDQFIALPVTYFIYFFMMFSLCYAIWQITQRINHKAFYGLIIVILLTYAIPIQMMNNVFSITQNRDYDRIVAIEQLLETNAIKCLNNNVILAPDLYVQRNALNIQQGYWTEVANEKGLNLVINKEDKGQDITLHYPEDKYFQINFNKYIIILSKDNLNNKVLPIKLENSKIYKDVMLKNPIRDKGFYVYRLLIDDEQTLQSYTGNPLNDFRNKVGNTLKSAKKLNGYYVDGWVSKISKFKIKSGKSGEIIIEGYYPNKITDKLTGEIYINDIEIKKYKITTKNFKIKVKVGKNEVVKLKI
ncbi:acyltransferase family protein, partial [Clostridium tepidiprofundi]|uniref:acyltransferase family protein n=1 Tax=Clostridium tepidiprofundi TaxID=420412 RepID=UPI0008312C15